MDSKYWSSRYQNEQTSWDIGEVSKPIIKLFEDIKNKELNILIPGCGNAYEAEYLYNSGFNNVYLIDIAKAPLQNFKKRNKEFPDSQIIEGDFFTHKGEYDIIVEQTFFCAINPNLRSKYVDKCHTLLRNGGKLIGVLFDRQFEGGPPFGGAREEYQRLFKTKFSKVVLNDSTYSITPRLGHEVILNCIKYA